MAVPETPATNDRPKPQPQDKEWMRRKLAEIDAKTGETYEIEPGLTPEILKERMAADMRARGIDPDSIRYPQDDEYYWSR